MLEKDALDQVTKAVADTIAPMKGEIEKNVNALSADVKAVSERVAKMESAPVFTGAPVMGKFEKTYKGYNLSKQGVAIREMAQKNPALFPNFKSEEKADMFAKAMLLIAKGLTVAKHKDMSVLQDIADFEAKTTLSLTSANGGYVVPTEFQAELLQIARAKTFALNDCRVIEMGTDTMNIPLELAVASVNWKGEATQMSQGEPTFNQVALNAQRLTAYAIATDELLADAYVDIVSILNEQFAYGILLELDNQVIAGTGSVISGVATASAGNSVVLAGISVSSITAQKVSDMVGAIHSGYYDGAKFYLSRTALQYMRTLSPTTGVPVFHEMGGLAPSTIYGFPYFLSEKFATDATAVSNVVFANMKRAIVIGRRAGAMTIEADPYGLFDYSETRFRMVTRWAISHAVTGAVCRALNS